MDDIVILYKMLAVIRRIEQDELPNLNKLTPEALLATQENVDSLMRKLIRSGLVEGMRTIDQGERPMVIVWDVSRPTITLAGMEYLELNPLMQEARKRLKNHG